MATKTEPPLPKTKSTPAEQDERSILDSLEREAKEFDKVREALTA